MSKESKQIKLDEGTIQISKNIKCSINLNFTYTLDNREYFDISTQNEGGGNYFKLQGVNEDEKDHSIKICEIEDLEAMITHFKKVYNSIKLIKE